MSGEDTVDDDLSESKLVTMLVVFVALLAVAGVASIFHDYLMPRCSDPPPYTTWDVWPSFDENSLVILAGMDEDDLSSHLASQSITHYHYQNGATSGFEMYFCYQTPAPLVSRVPTKTRLKSRSVIKKFNPHFIYDCLFRPRSSTRAMRSTRR